MKVSSLISACGLCASLTCALAAQTEQTSAPRPSPTSASASMGDQLALLKKMEGQWKVDVSVNTSLWNPHLFGNDTKGANPAGTNNPSDASRKQESTIRNGEGMQTFTAYSTAKLILGDNVLQQTTVMPDLKQRMPGNDSSQSKDSNRSQSNAAAEDMFRGLSLLSFDKDARTYSMVFLSNCESEIQLKSGTFQATSNQLIFNGSHEPSRYGNTPASSTSQPSAQPSASPSTTPGTSPSGQPNSPTPTDGSNPSNPNASMPSSRNAERKDHTNALMGCQVVVDIISPDEHRVTMYASDTNSMPRTAAPDGKKLDSNPPDNASPSTTKRSDSKGTDQNRTNEQNPNATDQPRNPNAQDKSGRPNATEPTTQGIGTGRVLYRAVFRRATGDDLTKARDMTRLTDAANPSVK